MKISKLCTLFLALTFLSCYSVTGKQNEVLSEDQQKEKNEIKKLIHSVLSWSMSENAIDLLPVVTDANDSIYISFDMSIHHSNLIKLELTQYFTRDFIDNYDQIIKKLNQELLSKETTWSVGELPPFQFAKEISPWCLCQDYSMDEFYDIEIIQLNAQSGDLKWKWKKDSSWKDFEFSVLKESQDWKISKMEGFDY